MNRILSDPGRSRSISNDTDEDCGKTMRNKDYKLLRFDDGHEEFYHLATDPDESGNLLSGALDTEQHANYHYLCTEMTTLVSGANFCNPAVGVDNLDAGVLSYTVFPNPFHSRLFVTPEPAVDTWYELINPLGQTIFSGKNLKNRISLVW